MRPPHALLLLLPWLLASTPVWAQGESACLGRFEVTDHPSDAWVDDLGYLQKLRQVYDRVGGCGDEVLYRLIDHHFQQPGPLQEERLARTVKLGEDFLAYGAKLQRRGAVYQTIGYFILGRVGQRLEKLGAPGEHAGLIQRLAEHRVHIAVKGGGKTTANLRQGNWKYLATRAWQKATELLGTAAGRFEDALGPEFFQDYFEAPRVQNARWQLISGPRASLLSDMEVYRLSSQGDVVGSAVWLSRPRFQAHYLAAGNVPASLRTLAGTRTVAMYMTGGFTNAQRQPEGLTVDHGTIVNAVLMPDRHGLVIVEESGSIRVINLQRDRIQLPRGPRSTQEIGNPFSSLLAYSSLLEWCRERRATAFQTQLLLFGDELLIDPEKVKHQLRERRLLALVRNRSTGAVHHVMFDITQSVRLDEPAVRIQEMLALRRMKVEALLNLDVGTYNILGVYDSRNRLLQEPRGPVPVDKATNVLVYTLGQ